MADNFPYVLLAVAVVAAAAVVAWTTVSSIRKRPHHGRREKLGPAEDRTGRTSANPYAPQDLPDPQGWTWLNGPP
jgi:hypothetical protein